MLIKNFIIPILIMFSCGAFAGSCEEKLRDDKIFYTSPKTGLQYEGSGYDDRTKISEIMIVNNKKWFFSDPFTVDGSVYEQDKDGSESSYSSYALECGDAENACSNDTIAIRKDDFVIKKCVRKNFGSFWQILSESDILCENSLFLEALGVTDEVVLITSGETMRGYGTTSFIVIEGIGVGACVYVACSSNDKYYDKDLSKCVSCDGENQYHKNYYCDICSAGKIANEDHTECIEKKSDETVPPPPPPPAKKEDPPVVVGNGVCEGKAANDTCETTGSSTATCKSIVMETGKDAVLRCVATACKDGYELAKDSSGNSQGWCKVAVKSNFDNTIVNNESGLTDAEAQKADAEKAAIEKAAKEKAEVEEKAVKEKAAAEKAEKEKAAKISALQSSISEQSKIINNVKTGHSGDKASVWKNADGDFNTSRLVSDSVAGVAVGSVGGLVTASVIKKNQIKKGFEDLNCVQSGTKISDWGDDFSITGAKTKADCDAAGKGRTNAFVWASKSGSSDDYSKMVEDTKNSENNACWARVEISSNDSRIKTDSIKAKYFMVGKTGTCGSWLDEAVIKNQILNAKKKERIGGTIAGVVGGSAVGVGSMELFGNKAIGGNVRGQKALSQEQLLKSQVLAGKDGEAEWKKYETAQKERSKLCTDLKSIGGTSEECK